MMSSNGSNIGYRGAHQIAGSQVDLVYQVATAINMAAAPGLRNTWTKSSNTVEGAIGLGDTFIGFKGHGSADWGEIRLGEMYMPYKTSTDRLNPFGDSWVTTTRSWAIPAVTTASSSAPAWITWSSTTRRT